MFKFDRNRIKDGWEKLCTNKQANKQTNKQQTDRQTNRHNENNGHLAVNQYFVKNGLVLRSFWLHTDTHWASQTVCQWDQLYFQRGRSERQRRALFSRRQSNESSVETSCDLPTTTHSLTWQFHSLWQTAGLDWVSEWVSSFLTAHQHIIGHSVP